MIEKILYDYLKDALSGRHAVSMGETEIIFQDVAVALEIPPRPPDRLVIIEKAGSSDKDMMDKATMDFQCYGESMAVCAALNQLVIGLVKEAPDKLDSISSAKKQTDYVMIDTTTKKYRYQSVFDVAFYD